MKITRTIIPKDLATNSLLSSFLPFLQIRRISGFQQVGGLVTINISVFCSQQVTSYSALQPYRIQQNFITDCCFCSYYSSMVLGLYILHKVGRITVTECDMKSAKAIEGDIFVKLQINICKFQNSNKFQNIAINNAN